MIGTQLGPYEIREEIGRGGMATVYRAYQPTIDRAVAVKVIHTAALHDPGALERFRREARLIARLEHPHILPIYDFDGLSDPPYIVMRLMDRGTLRDQLAARPLALSVAADLVGQVAAALDYAHAQGVIHRDIKPSNILLDRHGNAFVSDFGIARMAGGTGGERPITSTGAVIGTPDYMAPEQARGIGEVDGRADIYALGVLLFQLLTGTLPFSADTQMGVLLQHLQAPIPSAVARRPQLPPEADALFVRALAKEPRERPATAGELATVFSDLARAIAAGGPRRAAVTQVLEPRPVATPTPPSQEQQRVVSILHGDAGEYAALVEATQGADAARQALARLWEHTQTAVAAHGGLLVARGEHEAVAVWGAEVAREDDAERAVRTALALQVILAELHGVGEEEGAALVRMGVHTGVVLITRSVGATTPSAGGLPLAVARRLAERGGEGPVISHATQRLIRGVFDLRPGELLRLRGQPEPLATYIVLGAKARAFRSTARDVEGVETPLVGREGELRRLQGAFSDVAEEGEGQRVVLLGEAGVGKSRLLDALVEWVDLNEQDAWLFRAQATPEMVRQPYTLLRDLLRFRFVILDDDPLAVVRAKIEAGVAELLGARDDETAQFIGFLAGFDLSDAPHVRGLLGDLPQLVARARTLFGRLPAHLAAQSPVLLILDDLHYADEDSLELLEGLMASQSDMRLLLVAAARPELLERRPGWGQGAARLDLGALDRRASRELARDLLAPVPEPPRALRDLLVERSGGNPRFMEEIVRALVEERVIVKDRPDRWRVEESRLAGLRVPPTLVGLLQARLDALLAPERLVLQRAAVLGRECTDVALASMAVADGTQVANLPLVLGGLERRGFLERLPVSPFAGAVGYAFTQALLRDLLYETMLERQRRAYHQAAALWLAESERADELQPVIGAHYERAGAPIPAARAYLRAGWNTLRTSVNTLALDYFRCALGLLPEAPETIADRLEAHEGLGEAYIRLSNLESAISTYLQMRDFAAVASDVSAEAYAWNELAFIYDIQVEPRAAREAAQQALALASAAGDEEQVIVALIRQGWAALRLDEPQVSIALGRRALALSVERGDRENEGRSRGLLGTVYQQTGDYQQAISLLEQALLITRECSNLSQVTVHLNNLACLHNMCAEYDLALQRLEEDIRICREIGSSVGEIFALSNLAAALNGLGRLAEAEAACRRGIHLSEEHQVPLFSDFYVELTTVHISQGCAEEALATGQRSLELAREAESRREEGVAWRALALAQAASANLETARASFAESTRLLVESQAESEQGRTLRAWAAFERTAGELTASEARFAEARAIFTRLGLVRELTVLEAAANADLR